MKRLGKVKLLEVDKVKAFLTYFARKKYENRQEKNEFFNSFINRIILYDDKILIFYNTDDNHPTIIKRKNTEELISYLNDIASNGKIATNDCPNATGNNSSIVQTYKRKTRLNLKSSNEFHLAEQEGFEPSLRFKHTTPLAGEPLEPLGYCSS